MNVNINIENQESLKRKKKIVVISLSAALILTTLIAGFFLVKKSKESRYENDDIGGKVVDNEENNENEYFFEKTSGKVTTNILLLIVTGILFFFWENDKLSEYFASNNKFKLKRSERCSFAIFGTESLVGVGLFEKINYFGFATLGSLIVIMFLVEFILIGSISYLFSKDKHKKYFSTLKMSWRKRIKSFHSLSITKKLFVVLSYLIFGFVIALIARYADKYHPCCCRCDKPKVIIRNHSSTYCFGFCKVKMNLNNLDDIDDDIDINSDDISEGEKKKPQISNYKTKKRGSNSEEKGFIIDSDGTVLLIPKSYIDC